MSPDDELCLCFHVSWRKVINYARINQVRLPSQLADCQGAGTGCGWCRSFMERIIERMKVRTPDAVDVERWLAEDFPASTSYRQGRSQYIQAGKGKPPQKRSSESSELDSPESSS